MLALPLAVLLSTLYQLVSSQCSVIIKQQGFNEIIAHRRFANGSTIVVDDFGMFGVFNSAGVATYTEWMNLPMDANMGIRIKLHVATIDSAGEIKFIGTDEISYKYANGMVTGTYTNFFTAWEEYCLPIRGLADFVPVAFNNLLTSYSVKASGFLDEQPSVDRPNPFNFTYYFRTSVNPMLTEFHIISLSKNVISVSASLISGVYTINTTTANYVSSYFTFDQAYLITSSVGTSSTHMAFAYVESRANSNSPYPHLLSIHVRKLASSITISIPLNLGWIWSTAIHPILPKIYCLTSHGDLYVFDFTPGNFGTSTPPAFPSSTPSASYLAIYDRFADLEVLDSTTLLFRTPETLSFFDLATHTFTSHINRKPSFSRTIPGTDFMFLVYTHSHLTLYSTTAHTTDTSFTPLTGKIREVVLSPQSTPPLLFVLHSDKIDVYSYSTAAPGTLTLLQTKTLVQLTADITPAAGSNLGVRRIYDLAVLLKSPYHLVVSMLVEVTTGNFLSVMALFSTTSGLGLVTNSYYVLSTDSIYPHVSPFVDPFTGEDKLHFSSSDLAITISWSGTAWGSYSLGDEHSDPSTTYWALKAQLKRVRLPFFAKTTTIYIPSPLTSFFTKTEGYTFDLVMRDTVNNNYDFRERDYYTQNRIVPMDHIRGNMSRIAFGVRNRGFILSSQYDPGLRYSSWVNGGTIRGGVPYQVANNTIFITDGDKQLYLLSFDTCYQKLSLSYMEEHWVDCYVSNCEFCNAFNPNQCKVCYTGYYVQPSGQCAPSCSFYLLNGQSCEVHCPLDLYTFPSASPKECISDTDCKAAGHFILGDRCITTPCPSPSTVANATSFCIPVDSTDAAMYNQDTSAVQQCPGGTLYFYHYRQCTPLANLPTASYNSVPATATTPGLIYCDSTAGYFFDLVSQRCLPACGQYRGTHPTMGLFCASPAACAAIGYFTDTLSAPGSLLCSSSCPLPLYMDYTTSACVVACPAGTSLVVPSLRACMSVCSVTFFSTMVECLTQTECVGAGKYPVLSTMLCITACPADQTYDTINQSCINKVSSNPSQSPTQQPEVEDESLSISKIFSYLGSIQAVSKLVTPILMTSFFDLRSGSLFCMVAQTYTKLTLMTYLSFTLPNSDNWTTRYYTVFKEFLDEANESFLLLFLSPNTVSENKRYVCAAGFHKLCFLTVEDNFFLANFLSLVGFILQFILIALFALVCGLIRAYKWRDFLLRKLRNVMFFAFLLEKDLDFWASLLLNGHILVFSLLPLAISKALGLAVLCLYLFSLGSLLWWSEKRGRRCLTPARQVVDRWRGMMEEVVQQEYGEAFIKLYVVHNFLMSLCIVTGTFVSPVQMYLWAGVELLLTVLLLKFRVFKEKLMNIRQCIIESLFLILSIAMALTFVISPSLNIPLPAIIFIISAIILCLDILFIIFIFIRQSILHLKRKPVQENNKILPIADSSKLISPSIKAALYRMIPSTGRKGVLVLPLNSAKRKESQDSLTPQTRTFRGIAKCGKIDTVQSPFRKKRLGQA